MARRNQVPIIAGGLSRSGSIPNMGQNIMWMPVGQMPPGQHGHGHGGAMSQEAWGAAMQQSTAAMAQGFPAGFMPQQQLQMMHQQLQQQQQQQQQASMEQMDTKMGVTAAPASAFVSPPAPSEPPRQESTGPKRTLSEPNFGRMQRETLQTPGFVQMPNAPATSRSQSATPLESEQSQTASTAEGHLQDLQIDDAMLGCLLQPTGEGADNTPCNEAACTHTHETFVENGQTVTQCTHQHRATDREQNRQAVQRYRKKKKSELQELRQTSQVQKLEIAALKTKISSLEKELKQARSDLSQPGLELQRLRSLVGSIQHLVNAPPFGSKPAQ